MERTPKSTVDYIKDHIEEIEIYLRRTKSSLKNAEFFPIESYFIAIKGECEDVIQLIKLNK